MTPEALRTTWRRTTGKPMPRHLPTSLLQRILVYRQQANQHRDISRHALGELKRCLREPERMDGAAVPSPRLLKPGTVLVREHGGVMQQVLVTADGFAWQGQSYPSLSCVAFAITGTRWNGPRFFGLGRARQS